MPPARKVMAMSLGAYLAGLKQLETYMECLRVIITEDISHMPEHTRVGAINRTCYAYMALDQHADFFSRELSMNRVTEGGDIELTLMQAKEMQHYAETTSNAIEGLRDFHIDLREN